MHSHHKRVTVKQAWRLRTSAARGQHSGRCEWGCGLLLDTPKRWRRSWRDSRDVLASRDPFDSTAWPTERFSSCTQSSPYPELIGKPQHGTSNEHRLLQGSTAAQHGLPGMSRGYMVLWLATWWCFGLPAWG